IPKLKVIGLNWVINKDRFLWAVDARGLAEHLEEHAAKAALALTAAQSALDTDWKKEMKLWQQGEAIVKQQIAGTIPDSLFVKIRGKTTASDICK
ncbi:hypothetical protein B0H13DRAFT_1586908, partial [Mycena leptocephala]